MENFPDIAVQTINNHLEISSKSHSPGCHFKSHWHDYFEFEIVTGGCYEHTISEKQNTVEFGSAWIMTPLDFHSIKSVDNSTLINISFTSDAIAAEIADILSAYPGGFLCKFDAEEAELIITMCKAASHDLENKPPLWNNTVAGLVENILIRTIRKSNASGSVFLKKTPDILQSVISYINKNFKKDVSVSTVAQRFAISPGRLGLIFSKALGTSYNSYVNRIRLRHACNLLISTNLSAKQIAFDCGYSSVEYFFYIFRKELHTTPSEYRLSNKN